MKSPLLPFAVVVATLALHTSCKPKPSTASSTPAPEVAATPADQNTPPAAAAEPAAPPPQGNAGGGGPGNFQQRAEERMQQMKTELGLTDDQAQKVRAVFDQQFGPLRQQMGDQSVSREDRRAAFEKARAATNTEIEQILTPEQKPKWEAFQKEMEQRRAQRQQGGN
jgi:Spy/CpxP family protein refolding chaperone